MRKSVIHFAIGMMLLAGCNSSGNGESGSQVDNIEPVRIDQTAGADGFTVVNVSAPHVVNLDAVQVVGGSIEVGAGLGEFELDRSTGKVRGTIAITGVDADAVTLNRGFAGQNGPVLLRFDKISEVDWALPANAALTSEDVAAMDTGGLHVIASSTQSPEGAVRGQIVRSGAVQVYFFTLFGSQVVPALHSSATALGAITTSANVAGSGIVGGNEDIVVHLNVQGLEDVRSAHVHGGSAGENGPVLVELAQDAANPYHWSSRRAQFSEDAITGFENGYCVSGGCDYTLYLDVHTGNNPDGELRAQLGWPNAVQFVPLGGDDVVPVTQSGHFGNVATTVTDIFGWDWTLELAMHVNLHGIDDATSVTLNYAPVGQNGPVVYSLAQDPARSSHWSGRALLNEPANAGGHGWYITVATPDYPGGELRGQWSTQYNRASHNSGWFGEAFEVSTVNPPDGSTVASMPTSLIVEFTDLIHTQSADSDNVELLASGGDAVFGNGNDLRVTPLGVSAVDSMLIIETGQSTHANDVYRLVIDGIQAELSSTSAPGFISTFAVNDGHSSPTFAQLQQDIFTPSCAHAGCHGGARPAFGLDLSAGASYENIVGVPSAESFSLDLVEPGNAEDSYLVRKLFRPWWDPHPPGQQRLSNASMQRLRQWITEGAMKN